MKVKAAAREAANCAASECRPDTAHAGDGASGADALSSMGTEGAAGAAWAAAEGPAAGVPGAGFGGKRWLKGPPPLYVTDAQRRKEAARDLRYAQAEMATTAAMVAWRERWGAKLSPAT